jgi:hypothetical protein
MLIILMKSPNSPCLTTRARRVILLPALLPLIFWSTGCETPKYTEQGYDSHQVRQRWHDIASPETAPDYYGRTPSTREAPATGNAGR